MIGSAITSVLADAGLRVGDEGYGEQYNLVHAADSRFGPRAGMSEAVCAALRRQRPDLFTVERVAIYRVEFLLGFAEALGVDLTSRPASR